MRGAGVQLIQLKWSIYCVAISQNLWFCGSNLFKWSAIVINEVGELLFPVAVDVNAIKM